MSASVSVQSANSGITGTSAPASGQINPAYSLTTGYEGLSRPIDDMPEPNFTPHHRCPILFSMVMYLKLYKSNFIYTLRLIFQCFPN